MITRRYRNGFAFSSCLMVGITSCFISVSWAFVVKNFAAIHPPSCTTTTPIRRILQGQSSSSTIDFQSDTSQFGRGERHLSAMVNEGDVVVYQTGSWMVDGVVVGDSIEPSFEYCQVETIQVVWTHNCEHGVLRGIALELLQDQCFVPVEPLQPVEFGPEQLVARIPVQWMDDSSQAKSLVDLKGGTLWKTLQ